MNYKKVSFLALGLLISVPGFVRSEKVPQEVVDYNINKDLIAGQAAYCSNCKKSAKECISSKVDNFSYVEEKCKKKYEESMKVFKEKLKEDDYSTLNSYKKEEKEKIFNEKIQQIVQNYTNCMKSDAKKLIIFVARQQESVTKANKIYEDYEKSFSNTEVISDTIKDSSNEE